MLWLQVGLGIGKDAADLGQIAFQLHLPAARGIALFDQIANAHQLVVEQALLLHALLNHQHQTPLLRLQARQIGIQGGHIGLQSHAPRFEQMLLRIDMLAHQGVGHAFHNVGMKLHGT
jgi:hypothetical protein